MEQLSTNNELVAERKRGNIVPYTLLKPYGVTVEHPAAYVPPQLQKKDAASKLIPTLEGCFLQ